MLAEGQNLPMVLTHRKRGGSFLPAPADLFLGQHSLTEFFAYLVMHAEDGDRHRPYPTQFSLYRLTTYASLEGKIPEDYYTDVPSWFSHRKHLPGLGSSEFLIRPPQNVTHAWLCSQWRRFLSVEKNHFLDPDDPYTQYLVFFLPYTAGTLG